MSRAGAIRRGFFLAIPTFGILQSAFRIHIHVLSACAPAPDLRGMMTAYLIRKYHLQYTTGVFVALAPTGNIVMQCVMLELPWRDNERRVSCIPEGRHTVRQRRSDKFGQHFHVTDVPDRDWILQHPGTYTDDILGCQLPGTTLLDLNGDGIPDIRNTRDTLKKMLALLGREYTLHITSVEPPAHPCTLNPSTLQPIIRSR